MSSPSAALFKEHDKFVKRQAEERAFLASAEKRQKVEKSSTQKSNRPKSTLARSRTASDLIGDYRSSTSSAKPRLLIRATIVEKLQERFLNGQTDPISLDEIITEFGLIIDPSDKHWLASEALLSNPQIDVKKVNDIDKFVYKPPLDLKGQKKQALLNLLKSRHERCEGAITVDDVRDSLLRARADNIIESLIKSGEVIKVTSNKKEVLFYTDRAYDLRVNPQFIEAWRKISVEGLDEKQIVKSLDDQGHKGFTKNTPRPMHMLTKPSKRGSRRADVIKFNQHVADQLEDYSNTTNQK